MSTLRHPVGPQPPEVYWRRRLIVGLGLLAVIVIIVLIIVRPGSSDPAALPTPDPETTETTAPDDPADPTEVVACSTMQVALTPVTDASSYSADQQPLLSFSLVNMGAAPCSLEVGADVQEFLIVSGSDRIWASTDCQEPAEPVMVVLEPGVEKYDCASVQRPYRPAIVGAAVGKAALVGAVQLHGVNLKVAIAVRGEHNQLLRI